MIGRVPLLACPAVLFQKIRFALLDKPAVAPIKTAVTDRLRDFQEFECCPVSRRMIQILANPAKNRCRCQLAKVLREIQNKGFLFPGGGSCCKCRMGNGLRLLVSRYDMWPSLFLVLTIGLVHVFELFF